MATKQKLNISRALRFSIFSGLAEKSEKAPADHQGAEKQRRFPARQPSDITFGHTYLHLEQAGQKTLVIVAGFLNELDWSAFEARYGKC